MDSEAIEQRAQEFLASKKTLELATVGIDGTPTASYAPFVRRGIDFCVYTSGLSRHTSDMLGTVKVSALLIEDEKVAENPFALKRLIFSCKAFDMSRTCVEWKEGVLRQFKEKFKEYKYKDTGTEVFDIIASLPDFTLFALEPYEVVYVEGFGAAYRLTTELTNPVHLRGTTSGAKPIKEGRGQ